MRATYWQALAKGMHQAGIAVASQLARMIYRSPEEKREPDLTQYSRKEGAFSKGCLNDRPCRNRQHWFASDK